MAERYRDGRRLTWEEGGTPAGAPALFLHAGLGRGRMWREVWGGLDGLALRAPDLPGHGGTTWDAARDATGQAMADAVALIGPPAHVVGHSFGAVVALRLATCRPELVRSLTLIEPVSFALLHDARDPALGRYLDEAAAFSDAMHAGDHERAARWFMGYWGEGDPAEIPAHRWREMVARMPLIDAMNRTLGNPDAPGRVRQGDLAALTMPVLLVGGAVSPPVSGAILSAIEAGLPQARRIAVQGAGHMVPVTHPARIAAAMARFLRDP